MRSKMKVGTSIIVLSLFFVQVALSQKMLPCPAVNAVTGELPVMSPKLRLPKDLPTKLDGDDQIDEEVYKKALNVIGFFEAGNSDPWSNVSSTDVVSIGFLQWNWNTRSLIDIFFLKVSSEDIKQANKDIQNDLEVLKTYSKSRNPENGKNDSSVIIENEKKALAVIMGWYKDGKLNPIKRDQLGAWLKTDSMKKIQDKLIRNVLANAFWYARAWFRDSGSQKKVDARTVVYFFDLFVFNGGTAGLWVEHVKQFRSNYASNKNIVTAISNWLLSCNNFVGPQIVNRYRDPKKTETYSPRSHQLYSVLLHKGEESNDLTLNANHWKAEINKNENIFDDNQINLLIFGLLRAQLSFGNGYPDGFWGVFQAHALMRRGVIAVGGYEGNTQKLILYKF